MTPPAGNQEPETEREKFEAWMKKRGTPLCIEHPQAWDAWQAALAGASVPSQPRWQPIETAPKDVCVLLYTPNLHESNPERVEARVYHDSRAGSRHAWATHWMPIPAPPGAAENHTAHSVLAVPSEINKTALPGFLFIAMDDDYCANLTFCADKGEVLEAVIAAMHMDQRGKLTDDQVEESVATCDDLIENGFFRFEGDPGFVLYKLHDGASVKACAERQAFFLNQERERALAAMQAEGNK